MAYLGEAETDCVQERCVSTSEVEGCFGNGLLSIYWRSDN